MCRVKRSPLPPIQKSQYYSNILLLDPNREPLSTIAAKRANWYLRHNLAVEVEAHPNYTRTLQLTFKPKAKNNHLANLLPKSTCCVVCGAAEDLTLHHVVPRMIRRHFPDKEKSKQHLWCLLLCQEHHLAIETVNQDLITKRWGTKENYWENHLSFGHKEAINVYHAFNALRHILINGIIHKVPSSRIQSLLTILKLEKAPASVEELESVCPIENPFLNQRQQMDNYKAQFWKQIFEKEGISSIKETFRTSFLETLQPRFLPYGAMMDIP